MLGVFLGVSGCFLSETRSHRGVLRFDTDGNGELSKDEFVKAAMEDMGLSKREAEKIFESAHSTERRRITSTSDLVYASPARRRQRDSWRENAISS